MEKILVSACLLGVRCRYDGRSVPCEALLQRLGELEAVPVCPEILGGLPTPRTPAERQDGRVVAKDGRDVTAQYRRGAGETLRLARLFGCRYALLKERSPSCGCGAIYDGSFTGTLTGGDGTAAELLCANGVQVFGETRLEELLARLNG
ncbi:MAG TPA: DUF523 domain-containing protein [Candidatus Anaerofilum faecale]|nr:DUF523 domain-containing protein [Anaerofilum sp. An201]OUP02663.1 purine-nucleoside phosphorylase [Anaerofilum sp. An201]HIX13801.1 DUF523 domain-containing protein [Candidatus Anaerofilum faecale]